MLLSLNGRADERRDGWVDLPTDRLHDRPLVRATNTVEVYPPDIVKRRTMAWDGMAAEIVQATGPEKIEFRYRAPLHLLAVYDQGIRSDGETFVDGLPRSKLRDVRRKLTLVPAGHLYHEWQEPRVLARIVYFYFDPAKMPTYRETDIIPAPLTARLFFDNATLSDTALKLKRLIENAGSNSSPYLEALGIVLAHELVRLDAGAPRIESPVRGGLATWQQRTVATYIEEHLADQISLTTLARLVYLSPHHFCRAFRQSFGAPLHRYQGSHRIERAKKLLMESASSMTEIGLAVGFRETSSFTAAFRKATGQTPTAYRRSQASIPQGKQKHGKLHNLSAE
ncbi:MAG: AraC family transcriptional regulator [Bradyrhizobium sp.]|jgi:AraC family transcriptional regulator|nr:AraC family transcriptional regulator [Bradyrhizobium sp.]